jgi:hypothetical protein
MRVLKRGARINGVSRYIIEECEVNTLR